MPSIYLILIETASLGAVSWVFWAIFRQFFVKSPLDNIPGPPAKSFLAGVLPELFNAEGWDYHTEIAEKYGNVIKIKAFLGENQLYVSDPKALQHIVVKDQDVYEETGAFIAGNKLLIGPGLVATLGEQHRRQRKMLNPVFSNGHMREMVPNFYDVTYKVRDAIAKKVESGPKEIDILSWMTRIALELIGQNGLGYSFDSLAEDSVQHPYSKSTKQLIPVASSFILARQYLVPVLVKVGFPKVQRIVMDMLPWKAIHELRDIVDVLHNTAVEIFESKKKALEEGDEAVTSQLGQGKDILSILMRENMEASEGDVLSEKELIAQISTLTFAAMDTTSTAMSRIIYLLSLHPEVQERLREEIVKARKQHGDLAYDQLTALPYLEAVCRETLRLYPPLVMLTRTAREDIVLPLSTPIKGVDGKELSEIPIPRDTTVIIAIMAINRDPALWGPDSFEWKPERWLKPLPESVTNAHIPGAYSNLMTFLGGGRGCLGFKFAQLEMKTVLLLLLESFRFSPSKKEIYWYMNGNATPAVKTGVPLKLGETPLSELPMIVERVERKG